MMNTNLHDIQQDIQRLATQQSQIHAQHLQAQQLMQAQQIANMLNQQQVSLCLIIFIRIYLPQARLCFFLFLV